MHTHIIIYIYIYIYIVVFFLESSLGGVAAPLRRPRLSRPRLEVGEIRRRLLRLLPLLLLLLLLLLRLLSRVAGPTGHFRAHPPSVYDNINQ